MKKNIQLIWSEYRIQHILKHSITTNEVEEVIFQDGNMIINKYQKSNQFPGKYLYLVYRI